MLKQVLSFKVTVAGRVDPTTGMVLNISDLKVHLIIIIVIIIIVVIIIINIIIFLVFIIFLEIINIIIIRHWLSFPRGGQTY